VDVNVEERLNMFMAQVVAELARSARKAKAEDALALLVYRLWRTELRARELLAELDGLMAEAYTVTEVASALAKRCGVTGAELAKRVGAEGAH
jgi:hypothetical protein